MTNDDLQRRVEESPALRKLCAGLSDTVQFHADNSVQFDPLLVIAVLGIIVNILLHCKERKAEDIKEDIRNIRTIPPRKLMRLRRRINAFWRHQCGDSTITAAQNPVLAALYEISEMADDEQLDALLALANK